MVASEGYPVPTVLFLRERNPMTEAQIEELTKEIISKIAPSLQPEKSMYVRMFQEIKLGLQKAVYRENSRCHEILVNTVRLITRIGEGR